MEAIGYTIDRVGEDCVGVGTDFTQGYDKGSSTGSRDKGRYRRLTDFGPILNPEGIRTIGEFPNLTDAMARARAGESRIEKVIGANWLRVFGEVWAA